VRTILNRMLRLLAVTVLVAGSATLVVAGPASAADAIQTFRNRNSGMCLDDSVDFSVRQFTCNNTEYQRWTVHVYGDGTRRLANRATGRCLGAQRSGSGVSLVSGGCEATPAKSWIVERLSNGVRFITESTGSHCLSDTGGNYYGGRYVGALGCIGGYFPAEGIWY